MNLYTLPSLIAGVKKVFETTDIDNDWDGTFNGEVLNSATFAYYLELVYLDGEEYTENGKIALIR